MFTDTKYNIKEHQDYRFIKVQKRSDQPVLVLLHGMFGGLSNFESLIDHLQDRYTLFVPEIPLYELKNKQLSISFLSSWLKKVLTEHGWDQVILIGNSMGGHIALDFALKYPKRAEALVLAGSSGLFENEFGDSVPRRGDREYIRERAELTFYDPEVVTESLVDEIMEVVNQKKKLIKLLRLARATHTYNMESLLSEIEHPTLLVWGEDDQITPPEVAYTFERKLPDATLRWISECGHAPMMERPNAFMDELQDFLARLERMRN